MSEKNGESGIPSISFDSVPDALREWYQIPAMAVVLVFMLWVRVRAGDRFFRDGNVYLSGNDAWYHLREVTYTVQNYPQVMPFDPWTGFSTGTAVGQFGTLFDQLIATAALIVGLGSPSQETIAATVVYAPAVFGTLVAVPVYFIGRRLWGRLSGVFGAVTLALFPGLFLSRGVVGAADHNVAEPLFQSIAVLGMMVALAVAMRERPVWEQIREGEAAGLRRVLGWSALSGFATALYLWTWPPGVLIIGVFGVFFTVFLCLQYVKGESPEHAAIAGAVSLSVTGLLAFVPFSTVAFNPVQSSLAQPLLAFAVAAGCAFMAWLAREWDRRDLDRNLYPVAVLGLIAVLTGAVALALPDVFSTITGNLTRFIGFTTEGAAGTVTEAQPMPMTYEAVFGQYGLAFFVALFAALVALARVATDRAGAEELLLVVWFAFMASAAFTQVRFNYYLAVPVAILCGYTLGWLLNQSFVDPVEAAKDINSTHVFVALSVFLIVLAPLAVPVSGDNISKPRVDEVGNAATPGGVLGWDDTLRWMDDELPQQGTYGGADNAAQLPKHGTYGRTSDFDYPAGAYGVMSWWDYGHWLTTIGDTIPVANPFQQNAGTAANYLLAPNASASEEVISEVNEDDAEVRYTAIDWQMASVYSKFSAPIQFHENESLSYSDFAKPIFVRGDNGARFAGRVRSQRYYNSTMIRLFRYHGSAKSPAEGGSVTVVDWTSETDRNQLLVGEGDSLTREFQNISAARAFVEEDGTAQIGGLDVQLRSQRRNYDLANTPNQYIPALEHYRLVRASGTTMPRRAAIRDGHATGTPSYTKVFERVEGATVEGEGPANTTVEASVEMNVPTRNSTFTYRQRAEIGADGTFEMNLPYSTSGYDEWGTEAGYTNVSTRANGSYSFTTSPYNGGENDSTVMYGSGSLDVPEGAVIGEDDDALAVELETQPVFDDGAGNDSGNTSRVAQHPVTLSDA